ncbi:MAG: acetylxylan esterase [Victivallales bacterium]|nr:acetylxylan esterase [Victivallales bacterium]
MVNFASRIRCESFITTGLMDLVCPPDGVAALFNAMPAEKKTFLITPTGDHISTQLDKKIIQPHADRHLQHFKE